MRRRWRVLTLAGALAALPWIVWQVNSAAQNPAPQSGRFEFQVVESFDARYLGDSPGHLGRGSLRGIKPDVALGDPVWRKDAQVGKVTGLTWDRTKENLEIEFDPEPFEEDAQGRPLRPNRISVGSDVWVPLGGSVSPEKKR